MSTNVLVSNHGCGFYFFSLPMDHEGSTSSWHTGLFTSHVSLQGFFHDHLHLRPHSVCVCVGVGVHTVLVRARAAPTCTTSFPKLIHLTKKFSSFILNLLLPLLKIPKLSALLSVDLSHTQSLLFVSSSPPPSTENSFFLLASNYCYYSAYYVLYLS